MLVKQEQPGTVSTYRSGRADVAKPIMPHMRGTGDTRSRALTGSKARPSERHRAFSILLVKSELSVIGQVVCDRTFSLWPIWPQEKGDEDPYISSN